MLPYFGERFHNPQSAHPPGEEALEAIERARRSAAQLIGASSPPDIFFTSGATESNNWALKGLLQMPKRRGNHIVTSQIEHLSITHPCKSLERQGAQITQVSVDRLGRINPSDVRKAIRADTALVSITHASSEVGTIEPVAEIARVCREAGVPCHIDASNTAGHIPFSVAEIGCNLMTLSPHMFYGPKGIGALYCRRGLRLPPLLEGGTQEGGRRAGTENVPAIVGFGVACELAIHHMPARASRMARLRDRLIAGMRVMQGVHVTGDTANRLPHHVSCVIDGIESETLLQALALDAQVYAASGTACSAKAKQPSYVLQALGYSPQHASGSLVFGLGLETTENAIDYLLATLPKAIANVRSLSTNS
jgi:cysteine desulfurase